MKNRYEEIMDRVEVTEEMRRRILDRVRKADLPDGTRRKTVRFPGWKRYLSAAACIALLLAGVLALPALRQSGQPGEQLVTNPMSGMAEAASPEELSALVGFPVEEVSGLPFTPESRTYTAIGEDLAQIIWEGEGGSATFRKSAGTEDNSGDYNDYSRTEEITVGTVTAVLKGDGDGYTLAVWHSGGYAYSLRLSEGLTDGEWTVLIASVR